MTREIWEHARIATMRTAQAYELIEDGAIVTEGGCIAWVGPTSRLPAHLREGVKQTHNCINRCITPGLIDAHTHLVYAGNRAHEFEMRSAGANYADIARNGGGILSTVRATRAASDAVLYASAQRRLDALLNEGVTCIEIKSGYGLDAETELRQLRIARKIARHNPVTVRTTYLGLHTTPPEFANAADYVDFVITEVLPAVAAEGLADAVDAFCEDIAFTPSQIERFFTAAKKLGLRVKVHADQLRAGGGSALAARFHALSADHLEYANRAEIQALAHAGTVAILLPGAYYFLRETTPPPIQALRECGIRVALATDCNPGTSPVTSLLLMLNMGCMLFGLTPAEALAGVTINAAHALGIADTTGSLEPGKRADFVLWDIDDPRELAYSIGLNSCVRVIQNGTLVKDIIT